jgi:hypothetical protein
MAIDIVECGLCGERATKQGARLVRNADGDASDEEPYYVCSKCWRDIEGRSEVQSGR